MAKLTLSRNQKGSFQRDLGWKPVPNDNGGGEYRQHRFLLGRDQAQALIRSLHLETFWDNICGQWRADPTGPRPVWTAETLLIGMAIARGEPSVRLPLPAELLKLDLDPQAYSGIYLNWLNEVRKLCPMIQVDFEDGRVQQAGASYYATLGQATINEGKELLAIASKEGVMPASSQTLHQALDAYAANLLATLAVPTTAKKGADETRLLKEHAKDVPLAAFNLTAIEALIAYWQKRPLTKRGKPFAIMTVKDLIKRFRNFVRWLHKSPAFDWRKPADYEVLPVRIKRTPAEKAKRLTSEQVETYTLDELATLYEYATPIERLWLLLGLNCAFGNAELSTLQVGEIFCDYHHPRYPISGDFIRKLRHKTEVYGEWLLWPQTAAGLKWYQARRPRTEETSVFVSKKGRPLTEPTKGQNKNSTVFNTWQKLIARIRKDVPDFRKLSFNKLRKTATDLVRQAADGEIAAVFQQHGQPTSDDLADVYSNRPFDKVHQATELVKAQLAPMFAMCSDPFPQAYKKVKPSISLGTIKRIRELRQQGKKAEQVAEELGVSVRTVRHYANGK